MFTPYNPNPRGINTGDCVIRAICRALDKTWEKVYTELTIKGLQEAMWGDTKDRLVSEMEGMMNDVSPEAQNAIRRAISALNME